ANPRLTVTAALWVAAGAVIVLAYFFVPQYQLHRVMLHAKKTKLATTSFKIEEVLEHFLKSSDPAALEQLQRFCTVHQTLASMEEWPFDAASLVPLVGTLIIPTVFNVIELLSTRSR